MHILTILIVTIGLVAPSRALAGGTDALHAAIVAAVSARLGGVSAVEVVIVSGPAAAAGVVSAEPVAGSRLGHPMRFMISPSSGRAFPIVARVSVIAGHAVAARALGRGQALTPADVEWKEGRIDGQLLQPLPALADVLAARPRRSIAAGEIFNGTMLARPFAVRAGDEVALTFRSGAVEAHGIGRAVSSGSVGDVIRITRPGSRDIRRGRITAPAAVEIVR